MKNSTAVFTGLIAMVFTAACDTPVQNTVVDERPNILLIVADDLGYADLGVFGSDIDTPNIDALAAQGIVFTQFHTAVMCAPTRAMLMSGNNNHVAGMARQSTHGILGDEHPGYEAHLSDRIVPFPQLLLAGGYHTYMVGKWHLGDEVEHGPGVAGFERSYALSHGAGNHFNAIGFKEGGSAYREDGKPVEWPEGRYSTALYTDKLIDYIELNHGDGKPFFAFAAYTSPHWPLQVPDEYLDLYAGHYDDGYDRLREQRFESLKAAGIIPDSSALPPRNEAIAIWDDLDRHEQRIESREMELYAAMVDNLDDHVGRLVEYLKKNDLYHNTLIVFMSDNGPAGGDFYNGEPHEQFREYIREHHDNAYENMGKASSWVSYGPAWAEAGSAPFQRYKAFTREGGIAAAMIVSGMGVAESGVKNAQYLTVMDLAPTFLEIAGVEYPSGGLVQAMRGESINALLAGNADAVHDENYLTVFSHRGRAYIRQGKWKMSTLEPPFDESDFELFDMELDPGESNNLTGAEPEKYQELLELWRVERKEMGIVLPQDL